MSQTEITSATRRSTTVNGGVASDTDRASGRSADADARTAVREDPIQPVPGFGVRRDVHLARRRAAATQQPLHWHVGGTAADDGCV